MPFGAPDTISHRQCRVYQVEAPKPQIDGKEVSQPVVSAVQHTPGQLPLAADSFRRWFESAGHWVYEYRAEAVRVWRERGIDGRANYTPALGAALQPWVDADPLPAMVAKWNAERVAKQAGAAA